MFGSTSLGRSFGLPLMSPSKSNKELMMTYLITDFIHKHIFSKLQTIICIASGSEIISARPYRSNLKKNVIPNGAIPKLSV